MRSDQLLYLLDLQETQSLSKTAEKFFTSHQNINYAIKNLEKEFDIHIINRTSSGVEFTEVGKLFCNYATEALMLQEKFKKQIMQYQINSQLFPSDEIVLYLSPAFSHKYFFSFCKKFGKKYNLRHKLKIENIPILAQMDTLSNNQNFIALIASCNGETAEFQEYFKNYRLEILRTQKLGFCVYNNSKIFSIFQNHSASNYPNIPVVTFNYNVKSIFSDFYTNITSINNFDQLKNMLRNNGYIGIISDFEYATFFSQNNQFSFFPIPNISYQYIAISKKEVPSVTATLIRELKSFYQQ